MEFSRRTMLTGLGVAGGLVVGWALWPRAVTPNLAAGPGEKVFNPWLKISNSGVVTVIVPELEMGQGSTTLIAQIVADELGADWRTIAVEPAPLNPAYANQFFAGGWREGLMRETALQVSDGSATVRDYEEQARGGAAAARTLLAMAAAARWRIDWRACDVEAGFVTRGSDRLRFGELAAEAATFDLPDPVPFRIGGIRLTGRGMSRLDAPAKIDGSARFAADIRLPDMVYAATRQGPLGDSRLKSVDKVAAERIVGVLQIVEHERWVAAIATNWWAANKALDALRPKFETRGTLAEGAAIMPALIAALDGAGERIHHAGDVGEAFAAGRVFKQSYSVGLAPHAAIEPLAATAAIRDGKLELWIGAQLSVQAAEAAAAAIGFTVSDVILHPVLVGGSFGRKFETEIAAQAAILTLKLNRPVQLMWSRAEDMMHDRFRPAAAARMAARMGPAGRIEAWHCKIAAPDAIGELKSRTLEALSADAARLARLNHASARAVEGAVPPYAVGPLAIDHHPADIGVPTGKWRSDANSATAFFTESFIDELARASGVEPFSFRMALLGQNPRLAFCLSRAVTRGNWEGGGQGTGQGIACHAMPGAFVAVLAEASLGEGQRIEVTRLVAVADVGRVLNPDIARQQIEGALIFGMAAATGSAVTIERGVAGPRRLGVLGLPRLADSPAMEVELISSDAPPGPIGEIGVPAVAPAIANALFAGSGRRFRSLPLRAG